MGMGVSDIGQLREIGRTLAVLKEPEPPKGLKDAFTKLPLLKDIWSMTPHVVKNAPCQEIILEGDKVNLYDLPIQHCWEGDVAPLITWGLTVTKGPHKKRQNLGIYRQQLLDKNKLIMRWLAHRGVHWIIRLSGRTILINPILFRWYWVVILRPSWVQLLLCLIV